MTLHLLSEREVNVRSISSSSSSISAASSSQLDVASDFSDVTLTMLTGRLPLSAVTNESPPGGARTPEALSVTAHGDVSGVLSVSAPLDVGSMLR